MAFTNNKVFMFSCASSQPTAPDECHHEGNETSVDAALEFDFDFCAESGSESGSASTLRSESPDTFNNELPNNSATNYHLHQRGHDLQELPSHTPTQAPSNVDTYPIPIQRHPYNHARRLTLPTTTASRSPFSRPASTSPLPTPAGAAATGSLHYRRRSISKKPSSYDLRDDFLHAEPAAQAALARFQDQQRFQTIPSQATRQPSPEVPDSEAAERQIQGG